MGVNGEAGIDVRKRLVRAGVPDYAGPMQEVAATSLPDPSVCEQARLTRDARFDGLFFTAVTSTGIFCRPVCPAPPAQPGNVRYFATAAAAAAAGFRPCLRCLPERAAGASSWRSGNALVAGALRLIDDGFLDASPVAALAARVGVGQRQLRRLFVAQLGAGPARVAATRRLLFAKQLLGETALPVTEIALAAGYGSVRRFNAAFRDAYGRSPRELRRERVPRAGGDVCLYLPWRPPFDFAGLTAFFGRRALPGLETVSDGVYRRRFVLDGAPGDVAVDVPAGAHRLRVRVRHRSVRVLPDVVARVRRLFDLDADVMAVAAVLRRDPMLAAPLAAGPGIRVPGGWSGFEVAVRAVLGQQVSVAAARTLAARLVALCGERHADAAIGEVVAFPTPQAVARADLSGIGLVGRRAACLRGMAQAVAEGRVGFRPERGLEAFVAEWTALPGIGPWTAHYVAMRALGHPDAFPAADLVLRKAAGGDHKMATRDLERHSQAWRPWRAYATMLLWRGA